jgi:thioredoxin-related protein
MSYCKFLPIILLILSLCVSVHSQNIYEDLLKKHKEELTGEKPKKAEAEEAVKAKEPVSPMVVGRFFCDPAIKLNSVRQEVMTTSNYNKLMYRYKYFLLYVSATWCDYCCQHEKELLGVKQMLFDKTVEGEEIPIIQINADTDIEVLKDLKVGFFKVPSLYFVKEKQFIQYNSFFKADNIIRFINNILNPVVELHSVEDVEKFMDTKTNFAEKNDFLGDTVLNIPEETDHHLRIRLVGFFSDLEDYSAEYSQYLSLAEKISNRPDLRMGIVTDKEIVRHFKQIYEGVWFNSHSWNSIVLKRIDKYYFLDLSLLNEQIEVFVVYNSIPFIDELSNNNNFITNKIATPIALFFIDSVFILENFHNHLKFLIDVSKDYVGKYVVMYMDGNSRTKAKEGLGLKKESP